MNLNFGKKRVDKPEGASKKEEQKDPLQPCRHFSAKITPGREKNPALERKCRLSKKLSEP